MTVQEVHGVHAWWDTPVKIDVSAQLPLPTRSVTSLTAAVDTETTADDLAAAAEYIRTHGWIQKTRIDVYGHVCALGAIAGVTYHTLYERGRDVIRELAAEAALSRYLLATGVGIDDSGRSMGVAGWNDNRNTTKDDVINHLEKAAAWLREQAT